MSGEGVLNMIHGSFVGLTVEIRREKFGVLVVRGIVRAVSLEATVGRQLTGEIVLWIENEITHVVRSHSSGGDGDYEQGPFEIKVIR